ncbi:hypothetical protein QUF64_04025 [Anaerolineales bacterium HSG6]|nr:hypothetical protein [Anaerolineales bacterium HSG6]MDM8531264.1 hypothetical protein [Anaerolineales bacterium HSG25]
MYPTEESHERHFELSFRRTPSLNRSWATIRRTIITPWGVVT